SSFYLECQKNHKDSSLDAQLVTRRCVYVWSRDRFVVLSYLLYYGRHVHSGHRFNGRIPDHVPPKGKATCHLHSLKYDLRDHLDDHSGCHLDRALLHERVDLGQGETLRAGQLLCAASYREAIQLGGRLSRSGPPVWHAGRREVR